MTKMETLRTSHIICGRLRLHLNFTTYTDPTLFFHFYHFPCALPKYICNLFFWLDDSRHATCHNKDCEGPTRTCPIRPRLNSPIILKFISQLLYNCSILHLSRLLHFHAHIYAMCEVVE